jgi:DNA-binding NarL/FixJ family response regulator
MRVVLAEDHILLRDGLAVLLTSHGFDLVATVDSGPDLLSVLRSHRPDVAVVDVRLHPTFTDEGLQAALIARREIPGLPILVLSQHVEQLYARELLADGTGGIGYLLKDRVLGGDQFIDAVRRVAGGGTAMDPDVVAKLFSRNRAVDRLTPREVLGLMAEGRPNGAIGQLLFLSDSAVAKHIASIFAKLDLSASNDDNRRVLAVLAYLDQA